MHLWDQKRAGADLLPLMDLNHHSGKRCSEKKLKLIYLLPQVENCMLISLVLREHVI